MIACTSFESIIPFEVLSVPSRRQEKLMGRFGLATNSAGNPGVMLVYLRAASTAVPFRYLVCLRTQRKRTYETAPPTRQPRWDKTYARATVFSVAAITKVVDILWAKLGFCGQLPFNRQSRLRYIILTAVIRVSALRKPRPFKAVLFHAT